MLINIFLVGNHVVDVLYEGIAVGNTPYTAKCYDPAAIRVSGVGSGMVGKPVEFESKLTDSRNTVCNEKQLF